MFKLLQTSLNLGKISTVSPQIVRFNSAAAYKNILTEIKGEKKNVGFIQLNRPKALNALNAELMTELSGTS